jgi:hypothetical protein
VSWCEIEPGSNRFHEHVLLEDELLPCAGGPKPSEELPGRLRKLAPAGGPHDRLHKDHRRDPVGVSTSPVKTERAAPVVAYESDPLKGAGLEPGVQIASMVDEAVTDVRLTRAPHADEVGGKDAALAGQARTRV